MATRTQNENSCLNCRSRKVKCDRVIPQCSPCKKRKLTCEVPVAPPRMLWLRPRLKVGSDDELEDLHARRRPLFAAQDLAHNAADLLCIAGDSSVLSILDELDRKTEDIEGDETLCNGPFHVFQANDMRSPTPSNSLIDIFDSELWGSALTNVSNMLEAEGEDDSLQRGNASEPLAMEDAILQLDSFDLDGIDFLYPSTPATLKQALLPLASSPSRASALDLEDFSMPTAKMLLDHYRNNMVAFFTPARTEVKSPWEAIYIPSLLSTVGEIGLAGDSSNAKVSLLFAVFAISAFSLDGRSPSTGPASQDWNALGELYRERATRRLKLSLADLSRKQAKKEKYKDILMALLSMVTISVVSGKMGNAAHYLRDVEEIINLHGVQKVSRSSKVRMLHSIYLYLRVLTERASTIEYRSQSSTSTSSKDPTFTSSAQEIVKWDSMIGFAPSSPESGVNLDSASSPASCKSMFEEIYSVPQSLFKLILQTTHMIAMVEKQKRTGRPPSIDHDAFAAEVKDLESNICSWEYVLQEDLGYYAHTPLPGRELFPYHLVQAVHKALIVYFYRCVRDVNAAILQTHVQQIIHHLSEYDRMKQKYKDQSANTCWPGFIAGCEALDPQLREQIADWLKRSGQSNGIRMFNVALEAVQKVWQARSHPGMQNTPWNEVLAQFSELRVLVLS
ncbi:uncharacterized protein N7515_009807 [Penicillium bovifimosum]|uniref:Zn(2)-C6 fungal-type domain-containing protein n=1 Tax=Penicillium bovifimosum TaxID=126998 RepID=A0A9W9GID9_9EURO|nr:uncharacterized protein N7515_009807 [Penicillium bovifimosum]KAJ5120419.1 hypothetical protein N7515_009807 [Penicillium bovifimosum]